MNKLCIKASVSGVVQGVFFRKGTLEKALDLGITGWIKNTENGNVELLACGERDSLMLLTEWLWEGPKDAEVSNVSWEEAPLEKFDSFEVS